MVGDGTDYTMKGGVGKSREQRHPALYRPGGHPTPSPITPPRASPLPGPNPGQPVCDVSRSVQLGQSVAWSRVPHRQREGPSRPTLAVHWPARLGVAATTGSN